MLPFRLAAVYAVYYNIIIYNAHFLWNLIKTQDAFKKKHNNPSAYTHFAPTRCPACVFYSPTARAVFNRSFLCKPTHKSRVYTQT